MSSCSTSSEGAPHDAAARRAPVPLRTRFRMTEALQTSAQIAPTYVVLSSPSAVLADASGCRGRDTPPYWGSKRCPPRNEVADVHLRRALQGRAERAGAPREDPRVLRRDLQDRR